ncbi:DNA/RNA helicase domain-containing protein [Siccirubricoccus phaeus]|uniref:DNA/RNA helicase domain-containing protein n=1 Tax=Siccirubricoccus phaeus TaxID=2595053 RepID=UPI0011F3574D|nr:DNA/RNA helicase domain-containing protein [Siccirubricoccus phaeus]
MRAWLSLSLAEFRALSPPEVAARLAYAQASRFPMLELSQRHAWEGTALILAEALADSPADWRLLFEYDLLRLEKRADLVLLTDRAILVIEVKHHATRFDAGDLRQAEDYALDLHDFHAGSRRHPVVPVLLATAASAPVFAPPLLWHGVAPVLAANGRSLGALIAAVQAAIGPPAAPLDPLAWEAAPYRPVPHVLEAATLLYRRHSVADLATARADAPNLTRTTAAIAAAIAGARREGQHLVVFVTGIPGAGKTLCGLNIVFGALRAHGAAFLTGNVPLVAVLREALARDAAPAGGKPLAQARAKAARVLQNVHRFLDEHVTVKLHAPPEQVIVFDEAQRAWDARQATRDTQRRASRLTASEPAHALEIMGRHADWAVIVALIGQGQEINTGEAGLAEWGAVIAADPRWRALAAPRVLAEAEPAQRLAAGPWLRLDPELDLTVPLRQVRDAASAAWVEAVLADDTAAARQAAASGAGFYLTRDLAALRSGLRRLARGLRRAGLVASAGARRLRAEGLGVQAPEVAAWFLNPWPDIRGSEALETFATEYDCQGLELDLVGLAWGGDLIRGPGGWLARRFAGRTWQVVRDATERRFIRNTYRVLLTRARYETVIWVPPGSPAGDPFHDGTRPAAEMDAIAAHLLACGARPLAGLAPPPGPPDLLGGFTPEPPAEGAALCTPAGDWTGPRTPV